MLAQGQQFSHLRVIKFVKELSIADSIGVCDPPTAKNRKIEISTEIKGKKELEVLLHEALHACHWDLDEEAVYESANDIANMLWKCGFRKKIEKS